MQKAKAPAVVVPTLKSMTYDPHTTLADIPLTGGWEWVTGSTVPTAAQTDYPVVLAVDDGNYDYTGVDGDANHNDSDPASVVAKNAKAPISPTLSISGWTYGDEADAPALKGNPGKGAVTFQYSDAKDGKFTKAVPTQAGSWFVRAVVAETDNYEGITTAPVSFAISKLKLSIFADNKAGVYGDDIQELTYRFSVNPVKGDDHRPCKRSQAERGEAHRSQHGQQRGHHRCDHDHIDHHRQRCEDRGCQGQRR